MHNLAKVVSDDLRAHPQKLARSAQSSTLLNTATGSTLTGIRTLLSQSPATVDPDRAAILPLPTGEHSSGTHIGILSDASYRSSCRDAKRACPSQIKVALHLRFAPSVRGKRSASIDPHHTHAWPLCDADVCSLSHQCGGCRHPDMRDVICRRHGDAVHRIATAICQGPLGSCFVFQDAEGHRDMPDGAARASTIPPWALPDPGSPSRPDTVFFPDIPPSLSPATLAS